jgi:P4 family phage/plasmid primase-like protien
MKSDFPPTETSTPEEPLTTIASDASDASHAPLTHPAAPAEQPASEKIDPIVQEYGPLLLIEGDDVTVNQIAVAKKFTVECGISFDETAGQFRQYDASSGVLKILNDAKAKLALGAFLKLVAEKENAPGLIMMRTNAMLASILNLARGIAVMGKPVIDAGPTVHVANGVIEVSATGAVLREFRPEDWATCACAIRYNPKAKCVRFQDELLKPALSADDISLLQRFFGAVLMGLNAAQRFLVLYGDAASGKSTLVRILEWVIGLARVATMRTAHLAGRFEMHGFHDKGLLTAKDVASDFLAQRGAKTIKALIGDDVFETEQKYGGKAQLTGTRNVLVTSNAPLRLSLDGDEGAWRRRLLVIHFKRTAAIQRVSNFAEVLLKDEAEGILAWMIEGAVAHLKELGTGGDFELTQGQRERIEKWILASKCVEVFVTEKVARSAKAAVSVEELHDAYLAFCKAREWVPVATKSFHTKLPDLMAKEHGAHRRNDIKRGGKAVRGFKGVILRN